MHEVAYSGGLARPLIAPESALATLSADGLAEFVAANYTAPRIVLAGAGVTQVGSGFAEMEVVLGLCVSTTCFSNARQTVVGARAAMVLHQAAERRVAREPNPM